MRKYMNSLIILAISFSINSVLFAQDNFEGKIKFKITYEDEVSFLNYFIKGNNLRMEMGENSEAVFIKTEDKSLVLMPEEEMYMDLNNSVLSKLPGMSGMGNNENDAEENFDIDQYKTGKIQNILGYECHQWIFSDEEDDDEVEAWVTSELGNFMLMQSPMGAGYSPGWSTAVKNNGFFPLLVITRDKDGEENSRFEATEVNQQSLGDGLFGLPSNYNEMKIPGMDNLFK